MKKILLMVAMIATVGLAGCESLQNGGTKQTVGTAGGAILGGILGSKIGGGNGQLWATGAGALIGALMGALASGCLGWCLGGGFCGCFRWVRGRVRVWPSGGSGAVGGCCWWVMLVGALMGALVGALVL